MKNMYTYAEIDNYSQYCVGIKAMTKIISECLIKIIEINGRSQSFGITNRYYYFQKVGINHSKSGSLDQAEQFPYNTQGV